MDETAFQTSLSRSQELCAIAKASTKWKTPRSIKDPKARFHGFHQRKVFYKAGQAVKPGYMSLSVDIVMHESVPMTLSDGTKLYCDVFLPGRLDDLEKDYGEEDRVPGIVAWSPYGKQGGTQILSDYPFHCGVPASTVSGLQKWEGPDPAFWCAHNYAIINVDSRGTFTSEGDAYLLGHQEAQDGAEFVTWVSRQKWCTGHVGMSGNSWLAVAQWKIASLRPEGLAGIAPWEGLMDVYKDVICNGGICDTGGITLITSAFAGQAKMEDIVAAVDQRGDDTIGIYDAYWEDKRTVVERINVPVYSVASWTSIFHTNGTLRAWRLLPSSTPRWLRVHNIQEWPDYYEHRNVLDHKRFFDWSLKGQRNDWTATPRIRLSVLHLGMDPAKEDTIERAETGFPLSRTKYVKHYLTSSKTLCLAPSSELTEMSYDSESGKIVFEYTVTRDLETTGYPRAHLYMSTTDHDEMDIFVQIEKFTAKGWRQGTLVIRPKSGPQYALLKLMHDWQIGMSKLGILYHYGSDGRLRASFAHEKSRESTDFEPVYEFRQRKPLKNGEVRLLEVPMRAYGMFWGKGDVLRFTVSGQPIVAFALPGVKGPRMENSGRHILHVGGKDQDSSCLILPIV